MKRLIFITLTMIAPLISNIANAQDHEIRLSYGAFTSTELTQFLSEDFLATGITGGLYSPTNYKSTGAIGIDYFYYLSDRFSLGAYLGYEGLSKDVSYDKNKTIAGESNNKYFTLMPQVKYSYIKSEKFEMYSGISLGVSYRDEKFKPSKDQQGLKEESNTMVMMNYHANLLGFRYGNKLGVFSELGFGSKGIINAGVSYRF